MVMLGSIVSLFCLLVAFIFLPNFSLERMPRKKSRLYYCLLDQANLACVQRISKHLLDAYGIDDAPSETVLQMMATSLLDKIGVDINVDLAAGGSMQVKVVAHRKRSRIFCPCCKNITVDTDAVEADGSGYLCSFKETNIEKFDVKTDEDLWQQFDVLALLKPPPRGTVAAVPFRRHRSKSLAVLRFLPTTDKPLIMQIRACDTHPEAGAATVATSS